MPEMSLDLGKRAHPSRMNDTLSWLWYDCPRCGKVRVPDRDTFFSPIPRVEDLPEFVAGVGVRCPECGHRIWKDNDHWDYFSYVPTLRP